MPVSKSLGDELLAGDHDRVARDAKLLCELAGRRQAAAGLQYFEIDRLDQFLPDLRLQVQRAVAVQVKQRLGHGLPQPTGRMGRYLT